MDKPDIFFGSYGKFVNKSNKLLLRTISESTRKCVSKIFDLECVIGWDSCCKRYEPRSMNFLLTFLTLISFEEEKAK